MRKAHISAKIFAFVFAWHLPYLAYAEKGAVTYAEHVAPILNEHCVVCHHPGGIGPMSFVEAATVRNFAAMIKEVVSEKRMPPWHANPKHGNFKNDRSLSAEEIATISAWVDARTPMGNLDAAPAPPAFNTNWLIGEPDMVIPMPEEVTIQAEGSLPYQHFRTPTNFEKDMYVKAAEIRPGNHKVVHHIIIYNVSERDGNDPLDGSLGIGQGWIKGYAPGVGPLVLPEGAALKIPKGATLLWQVHYTPTGKEEKDRSELGLIFTDVAPKYEVKTGAPASRMLNIPAGDPNYETEGRYRFPEDATVFSLQPHMHLRGKSFRYTAKYPDGKTEILLDVPRFDFNWQNTYEFAEPKFMPKGTKITCEASFDNSAGNPANPDPTKNVEWGDQTWDEMMIGFFDFVWGDAREIFAGKE